MWFTLYLKATLQYAARALTLFISFHFIIIPLSVIHPKEMILEMNTYVQKCSPKLHIVNQKS